MSRTLLLIRKTKRSIRLKQSRLLGEVAAGCRTRDLAFICIIGISAIVRACFLFEAKHFGF